MTVQIDIQPDAAFQRWKMPVMLAATRILEQLNLKEGSLTILLTDDRKLREMNQKFAGEDQTTDVLSFPSGEPDPESGETYLGDILIAVPVAEKHAVERGHQLEQELSLLTIHGVLHLLGYDHTQPEDEEQMWALQKKALGSLGIPDIGRDLG